MTSKLEAMENEALIARVGKADRGAFAVIIDRHALRYRSLAYRYLLDVQEAEDCVQDCFLKLWQRPSLFNAEKARFTTWFHRLVVNRALDMKRKKRPSGFHESGLAPDYDPKDDRSEISDAMVDEERWDAVEEAVSALKLDQQSAITLTYFEGLGNKEAAALMNMTVKGFESLLGRARNQLKVALRNWIE